MLDSSADPGALMPAGGVRESIETPALVAVRLKLKLARNVLVPVSDSCDKDEAFVERVSVARCKYNFYLHQRCPSGIVVHL